MHNILLSASGGMLCLTLKAPGVFFGPVGTWRFWSRENKVLWHPPLQCGRALTRKLAEEKHLREFLRNPGNLMESGASALQCRPGPGRQARRGEALEGIPQEPRESDGIGCLLPCSAARALARKLAEEKQAAIAAARQVSQQVGDPETAKQ